MGNRLVTVCNGTPKNPSAELTGNLTWRYHVRRLACLGPTSVARTARGRCRKQPCLLSLHSLRYGDAAASFRYAVGIGQEKLSSAAHLNARKAMATNSQACNICRFDTREPRHTLSQSCSRVSHAACVPSNLETTCQVLTQYLYSPRRALVSDDLPHTRQPVGHRVQDFEHRSGGCRSHAASRASGAVAARIALVGGGRG